MTTRYMRRFFDPRSIAVIGASERPNSLGGTVLDNLRESGYSGDLVAVNPRGEASVFGIPCFSSIADLPSVPELAIVCTSAYRIPSIIDELGKKGVKAVLIVMGGFSAPVRQEVRLLGQSLELPQSLLGLRLESGQTLKEATWEVAQSYDMRIMGPNCIGTVVPRKQLNASYADCMVQDGNVAYVGQSGVLALAIMDWARGRDLGFSHLTSVGDSLDVDISDILEYLADDVRTRAILLHVEQLDSGRRFVSALRAAARTKLVIVLKSRRVAESSQQPGSEWADSDRVYDAVFRRAGVLRVNRSDELFNALETLTRTRRLHGESLAIVCNGIGPALLATDQLVKAGGRLAGLSKKTRKALRANLPNQVTTSNPVDISVAATPEHFVHALEILRADRGVSAILVLHVPTRVAPSRETANAVTPVIKKVIKPVLSCWMGLASALPARAAFDAAGISTFDSLEQAVDAFVHVLKYRRNQAQLDQIPRSLDQRDFDGADKSNIWALVGSAQIAGRQQLTAKESLNVIALAGIAVDRRTRSKANESQQSLQTVMGITRDPVFGPLLFLGTGDNPTSAFSERRVGLPPLNLNLARTLVESTAIGSELDNFSANPESIRESLAEILVRLGQLLIEVPAIAELTMVPLITGRSEACAGSARITLGARCETAIIPYPSELEETIVLSRSGRQVMLRPIRGEDAPAHAAFALRQNPESIRYRFFGPKSGFSQHELAQFTQIDYAREMAFIATADNGQGEAETLGVVRTWTDPDNVSAEFAVIVDDSMHGEGLGYSLMQKIIDYTRQRGTLEICGTVLSDNAPMRQLARKLGFRSRYSSAQQARIVTMLLNEPTDDWQRERLAGQ